jgi:hypothetical protein
VVLLVGLGRVCGAPPVTAVPSIPPATVRPSRWLAGHARWLAGHVRWLAGHVRLERPRLRMRPAVFLSGRPRMTAVLARALLTRRPGPGSCLLTRCPRLRMPYAAWPARRPWILVTGAVLLTRPRLRIPGSALPRGRQLLRLARPALPRGRPLLAVASAPLRVADAVAQGR